MENSTSESGIFDSKTMKIINRKGKECYFSKKLKKNLTKYLFDFFYYRELYDICSTNIFFYQCFTEYQLMTWKLEMNNIIDIFHLDIKNYKEEVDDTLTQSIKKKRTYSMKDHPGCFVRINRDGINIITSAYNDNSIQAGLNKLSKSFININAVNDKLSKLNTNNTINENELLNKYNNLKEISNLSETPSYIGSAESINLNKSSEPIIWNVKYLNESYIKNYPCINLIQTAPLNFGFSFYHIIKGDYQLYLHHSLINMKNSKLILKVFINDYNIYTMNDFPSNDLIDQDEREQEEKESNIKLREYLICSITKKMFEDANNNKEDEKKEKEITNTEKNIYKDYEIRVTFQNRDLFWKAGWVIDGGRLLRKVYKIEGNNKASNFKRFNSDNIDMVISDKYEENKKIKLKSYNKNKKRKSVDDITNQEKK